MPSLVNFTEHLGKIIIPVLHKLFQKIEVERILSNLVYKVSITLKKILQGGEKKDQINYRPVSLMNIKFWQVISNMLKR